jgi:hypothetical protein
MSINTNVISNEIIATNERVAEKQQELHEKIDLTASFKSLGELITKNHCFTADEKTKKTKTIEKLAAKLENTKSHVLRNKILGLLAVAGLITAIATPLIIGGVVFGLFGMPLFGLAAALVPTLFVLMAYNAAVSGIGYLLNISEFRSFIPGNYAFPLYGSIELAIDAFNESLGKSLPKKIDSLKSDIASGEEFLNSNSEDLKVWLELEKIAMTTEIGKPVDKNEYPSGRELKTYTLNIAKRLEFCHKLERILADHEKEQGEVVLEALESE